MKNLLSIILGISVLSISSYAGQPSTNLKGTYHVDILLMGTTFQNILDLEGVDASGNIIGTLTVKGSWSNKIKGTLSPSGDFIFAVGNQKGSAEFSGKLSGSSPAEFVGQFKGTSPSGPIGGTFSTTKLMAMKSCKNLLQKCEAAK